MGGRLAAKELTDTGQRSRLRCLHLTHLPQLVVRRKRLIAARVQLVRYLPRSVISGKDKAVVAKYCFHEPIARIVYKARNVSEPIGLTDYVAGLVEVFIRNRTIRPGYYDLLKIIIVKCFIIIGIDRVFDIA